MIEISTWEEKRGGIRIESESLELSLPARFVFVDCWLLYVVFPSCLAQRHVQALSSLGPGPAHISFHGPNPKYPIYPFIGPTHSISSRIMTFGKENLHYVKWNLFLSEKRPNPQCRSPHSRRPSSAQIRKEPTSLRLAAQQPVGRRSFCPITPDSTPFRLSV